VCSHMICWMSGVLHTGDKCGGKKSSDCSWSASRLLMYAAVTAQLNTSLTTQVEMAWAICCLLRVWVT
jgi:hypothetical protein